MQFLCQIPPAKQQADQDEQEYDGDRDEPVQHIGQHTDMLSLRDDLLLQTLDGLLRILQGVAVHLHVARILSLHLALYHFGIDGDCSRALICGDRRGRVDRAAGCCDIQHIFDRIAALAGDRDHNPAGAVLVQRRSGNGIDHRCRVCRARTE